MSKKESESINTNHLHWFNKMAFATSVPFGQNQCNSYKHPKGKAFTKVLQPGSSDETIALPSDYKTSPPIHRTTVALYMSSPSIPTSPRC